MYRSCLLVLCLIGISYCADAMFGLTWGVSPRTLKASGLVLVKKAVDRNIYVYSCNILPKNLSIAESYLLLFDGDTSLVKITMVSVTFTEDLYGTEGKEKFDDLVSLLISKGNSVDKSYASVGNEVYEDEDEFYECLGYEGCGLWMALMSGENKRISINLNGLSRGKGYIRMTIEGPDFEKVINKYNGMKKSSDADALE